MLKWWALAAAVCLLQSCVYYKVPEGNDTHAIDRTNKILEGVSTHQDVLDALGEPKTDKSLNTIEYSGHRNAGSIEFFLPQNWPKCSWPCHTTQYLEGEDWTVRVTFDDSDYVQSIVTTPNDWSYPNQRERLMKRANNGSAVAHYEISKYLSAPESLWWLCRSANDGYPVAQYQMGRYFETLAEPDYAAAYVWHNLAAQEDLPASQAAIERLSVIAPSAQLSEGKRRAASWQPDAAFCDALADR